MKPILFILFVICYSSIFGQNLIDYTSDFDLLGDVKKVEEKSYSLIFIAILEANGKLAEQSKLEDHRVLSFNKKNMLIDEYEKNKYGDVVKCQYIYDKNDSLIDIKYNQQSSLNRRLNKISAHFGKEMMTHTGILKSYKSTSLPMKNFYDSKGRISKVYYQYKSYNNKKISNCNFSYDGSNLKSIDCYDSNEKIFSKREYSYDEKNKILKEKYKVYNNQELKKETTSFFNNKGIITKEYTEEYKNDKIHLVIEVIYTNFKKLSTIITNPTDNTIRKKINEYDLKGNLLSRTMINKKGDSIVYKNFKTYSYDKHNNILSYKETSFDSETVSNINEKFKYKYDKNANWIIKCNCLDNEPVKTTLRKIDYHNSASNETINKTNAIFFCDPNYEKRLKKLRKEMESDHRNDIPDIEEEEN
ncbi:hypothetical protein [Aquimarina latercula]|uniref:hypothetical protein n=1 Tax=Aquimarina latercula TaxID=987 RepID=UPI000402568E|nr:hypothetical protein [Aquimarina latercula]